MSLSKDDGRYPIVSVSQSSACSSDASAGAQRRRLIVNADDYGYTPGVSEGIRLAHRNGIVTSTTVMMTMPHAREELQKLAAETPTLRVGVHLTVTEGRPFRLDGFFRREHLGDQLDTADQAELRGEWEAQIEALLATGLRISHLDSHHHATYLRERSLLVLFELAKALGVPVRRPYPLGDAQADRLAAWFVHSAIRYPDTFLDVFDKERTVETLLAGLAALPAGATEFMVHPGIVDDELRRFRPAVAHMRAEELQALVDPRVRLATQQAGIDLISFDALRT